MIEKSLEPMNTGRSTTNPTPFPSDANLVDQIDRYTDMVQLNRLEQDWTYQFVKFLLSETQETISFRADFMLDESFRQYFFEQEETLQQQGRANFALGFPIVGFQEGEREVLTPLLIWELSLDADPEKAQTWTIQQATHQTCFFNRQLLRYTPSEAWTQIWPLVQSLERKGQDSPNILAQFCNQLAELTGFGLQESAISLGALPREAFSLSSEDQLHIHWAGVFGNFPLDRYWQTESGNTLVQPTQAQQSKQENLLAVGPRVLDPWQAAAFADALQQEETWISGEEGTGKTYLLTHLLSSLLWQKKRIILVAPMLDDLHILEQELESLGLAQYSLLIANGQTILSDLQQSLKTLSQGNKTTSSNPNKKFASSLQQWQKEKAKLDQQFQASRQPAFGSFNRIDTLAFMLRSGRTEGKELLASQLDPKDFEFSPREMEKLSEAIERSEPLFDEIRTLAHPLNNLNAGIFLHKDKEEALDFIQQTTKHYLDKATELQYAFIRELDHYSDQLLSWHDVAYQALKTEVGGLQDTIAGYQQQFSRDTMESAPATLKLYGAISKKFQRALDAQEDLQIKYEQLEEKTRSYSFFVHEFLEGRDRKLIEPLEANLNTYQESLEQWRADLAVNIQEEVSRLNSKTAHAGVDNKEAVLRLETQFDIFLDELNASGLYQLPVQSKTLTFPKRQRFLQECMEQLERTRLNLRDFSVFYDWQKHWFFMPALARRIVTALVKVRPKSWLAAFESWYFEQCLTREYQPLLHSTSDSLAHFVNLDDTIRSGFLQETKNICALKRQAGLKRLKQDNKSWKDWMKAKEPSYAGLLQCCDQDLAVLTDVFPIIFTTPVEASILFEQTQEQLDFLIYWGNSAKVEVLPKAFSFLAKQRIFFTSTNKENGAILSPNFHLRSTYWQSPLDPNWAGKEAASDVTYTCEFVNGRFDEKLDKNEEEAQAILQALNGVTAREDGHYPSVCLVCFTKGQRNLLLTYVNQIKQQALPGHEHILELEKSGLQILHLGAISKKPFDTVFVSVTYGQTGVKGAFSKQVTELEGLAEWNGLQQLRNLAQKECRIFHSIPEKVWKKQWPTASIPSLNLVSIYLTRIQELAADKEIHIAELMTSKDKDTTFAQEVAWRIAPHIATNRLLLDQAWESLSLPLILLPQQESQGAMLWLIDGFLAQGTATDYTWEYQHQSQLQESGYELRNLATFEWWKHPVEQTQRLLADIAENDRPKFTQEEE